jgi:hypothetical protein
LNSLDPEDDGSKLNFRDPEDGGKNIYYNRK